MNLIIFVFVFRVSWKPITRPVGEGSCMVTWRDSLIVFGGGENPYGVQLYNVTTGNREEILTTI